ncbi:hypothetical protein FQA39_LY10229 [Lamprigera yunnana]|nr:hypothetical protein FQA39_LY10229 [Lamprigera yunnana]
MWLRVRTFVIITTKADPTLTARLQNHEAMCKNTYPDIRLGDEITRRKCSDTVQRAFITVDKMMESFLENELSATDDNIEETVLRWLEELVSDEEDILDEDDGSESEEVSAVEELDQVSSSEQSASDVEDENVPELVSSKLFIKC